VCQILEAGIQSRLQALKQSDCTYGFSAIITVKFYPNQEDYLFLKLLDRGTLNLISPDCTLQSDKLLTVVKDPFSV